MLKLTSLKSAALVSVTAAATTLLIQACGGGDAVAQSASDADVVEGVWDSTVTNKDCTSGAVLGAPFKALIVFRRGGTFDADNAQGRALRGNIYGIWKHGAGTAYTANAVHQRFNPDGTYAGTNKVQRSLTLAADASTFTSTLAVQMLDTSGNVVGQACPTETAVRMNL
ncbi:MAG TPA: hypothetical protein VFA35_08875 [Burkholderiaceae bacterium]|nr:hypothetical protein [Burkholderiaceae bacterium]